MCPVLQGAYLGRLVRFRPQCKKDLANADKIHALARAAKPVSVSRMRASVSRMRASQPLNQPFAAATNIERLCASQTSRRPSAVAFRL